MMSALAAGSACAGGGCRLEYATLGWNAAELADVLAPIAAHVREKLHACRALGRVAQQQSQLSPRHASLPSLAAMAAIASAATGSPHHQPSSAFASRPTSSAIER